MEYAIIMAGMVSFVNLRREEMKIQLGSEQYERVTQKKMIRLFALFPIGVACDESFFYEIRMIDDYSVTLIFAENNL